MKFCTVIKYLGRKVIGIFLTLKDVKNTLRHKKTMKPNIYTDFGSKDFKKNFLFKCT